MAAGKPGLVLAQPADLRSMSRHDIAQQTCSGCRATYKSVRSRRECQQWHKDQARGKK